MLRGIDGKAIHVGVDREPVDRGIGRRRLDADGTELDLQLLGHQHRQRRIRALPHLDLRQHYCHDAVGVDADERVEIRSVARVTGAPHALRGDAEDQRTTGGSGCQDEMTTGERGAHEPDGGVPETTAATRALRRTSTARNRTTATTSETTLQKICCCESPGVSAMPIRTAAMPPSAA